MRILPGRDPHERVRAALRPHRIDRGIPGRHETFIGVDRRVADRGRRRRVREQAADDVERRLLVAGIRQAKIGVEAATRALREGFGHEGRLQSEVRGDVLRDRAQRQRVIGGSEGIVVRDVDLVLSGTVFVVRRCDRNAHRAQRGDHRVARLFAAIVGRKIKIRSDVGRRRGGGFAFRSFEQIEFDLETGARAATTPSRFRSRGAASCEDNPRTACRPAWRCRRSSALRDASPAARHG